MKKTKEKTKERKKETRQGWIKKGVKGEDALRVEKDVKRFTACAEELAWRREYYKA